VDRYEIEVSPGDRHVPHTGAKSAHRSSWRCSVFDAKGVKPWRAGDELAEDVYNVNQSRLLAILKWYSGSAGYAHGHGSGEDSRGAEARRTGTG
jgi:hypothetical protein